MSNRHDNWMPLYCDQYRRITTRLSESLRGMYVDLLLSYWQDGPLPDDDDQLWRIARTTPNAWTKARPGLAALFIVGDGVWRNEWLDAEIAKAQAHLAKKSSAGRAGAISRWNGKRMADALASHVRPQCLDDAPSPKPLPSKNTTNIYQTEREAPPLASPTPADADLNGHRGTVQRGEPEAAPGIASDAASLPGDLPLRLVSPRQTHGTRLPVNWTLPEDWADWATANVPHIDVDAEAAKFLDYWIAQPGSRGRKADWAATWRNWVRRSNGGTHGGARRRAGSGLEEIILELKHDRQFHG